jgi:3-dehydroquinate synthetase
VRALFGRLGLPSAPSPGEVAASWSFVAADKKRAGTHIRLPVIRAPGEAKIERIGLDSLRDAVLGALG